ncbi:MAG: large conductance mechanosensitive channel protein MscL [Candidatus Micrarchaeales archaeon]
MSLAKEFKDFIMKGDVIDLAVAVIIGLAFNAVVTAFVTDIITPLIGIPGHVDFTSLTYTINGSMFLVGPFINAIINFITIALVVFFFIVKPISKMKEVSSKKTAVSPTTKQCPECLSTIPIGAKRCAFCTSKV